MRAKYTTQRVLQLNIDQILMITNDLKKAIIAGKGI
jgi:hypothetical protein